MCGENIGSCVKNLYLSSWTEKDLYICRTQIGGWSLIGGRFPQRGPIPHQGPLFFAPSLIGDQFKNLAHESYISYRIVAYRSERHYVGKTGSKRSQLLEGERYSVHNRAGFLVCAGLDYLADTPNDHPKCL